MYNGSDVLYVWPHYQELHLKTEIESLEKKSLILYQCFALFVS
jgi:hypothetical protein